MPLLTSSTSDSSSLIQERATRRGQALSKNDETLGVVFFPWVLYRFYLLHEEYKKNSLPFNLRTILVYDANLYESCVSQESIRACHENPEFGLEYKWMTLFGKLATSSPVPCLIRMPW